MFHCVDNQVPHKFLLSHSLCLPYFKEEKEVSPQSNSNMTRRTDRQTHYEAVTDKNAKENQMKKINRANRIHFQGKFNLQFNDKLGSKSYYFLKHNALTCTETPSSYEIKAKLATVGKKKKHHNHKNKQDN